MNVNLPLLCVATLISVTYPVSITSIYFHPNKVITDEKIGFNPAASHNDEDKRKNDRQYLLH